MFHHLVVVEIQHVQKKEIVVRPIHGFHVDELVYPVERLLTYRCIKFFKFQLHLNCVRIIVLSASIIDMSFEVKKIHCMGQFFSIKL